MSFLRYASIRQKLIAIILAVTIISLFGGFSFEIYNNILSLKRDLVNSISLDAKLISDYAVPTILFDDIDEAGSILEKLSNIPSVLHGDILNADGKVFAEYYKEGYSDTTGFHKPESLTDGNSRFIFVTEPIKSENEIIGKVNLVASTNIIREKTGDHIRLISLIFLLTSIFAVILAFLLERIISYPILNLSKITRKIQESGDFSVRVKKESYDETGILYDSFNDLLQSIEERKAERDFAEAALIRERENLEIRVNERTIELSAAKEKAEESDKLKSAFLANMSHEIRTPLNAILGFSNLFVDPSTTVEERTEYIRLMDASGTDLIKLIDDILDISRIEANQVKVSLTECQVNEISKEIFETFRQTLRNEASESSALPILRIPDLNTDFVMMTDRLRLKQVLSNILNNAIKFTPAGSIEFGYFADETNKMITFYIKDTGIGIPFVKLETIFDRFTKVADIKTKHYRGTGLGLSIALKLTQMLGGNIKVESEEKKGSVFYVSFPFVKVNRSLPEARQQSNEEVNISLKGKVILIAEDVDWNFHYLEILLSSMAGAKVLWAQNGLEAVSICREHPEIDLILMDVQMPEMNGYDATRIIKEFRPNLPVVAQSAYAMHDELEVSVSVGCSAFLAKPFSKKQLFNTISEVLCLSL
jgi:signal transduction histidine kinase/CheY-like chemotaxis protein